ncbi:hypothetical protein, partial [Staphylococcus felis]|uniref:hypothetical protein n=1 Tax=Staphylococcus felis TaxID=46127 RepID=UPI00115F0A31
MPGYAFDGGDTDTSPSSGSTVTVQSSGMPAGGTSNCVPGGNSVSHVCGTVTGLPGVVFPSSYPGVFSSA